MQKLILASNSAGKLREFQALLAPLQYEVIPQGELGIPAAPEPFHTFVENALAKARHASALSGFAALADDSGICAHALQGAPGVRSARYAGEDANDLANNQKLIAALAQHSKRSAHYVCALVLIRNSQDPEPLIVQTQWYGEIISAAKGNHGFGYDPHFYLPELGKTAAQLEPAEKNQISHRALALKELLKLLQQRA